MSSRGPRSTPYLIFGAAGLVLMLAGCTRERPGAADPDPQVLISSPEWQQTVEPETFQARLRQLHDGLERLRARTTSGWVGRQDEITGYLRELRGGAFPGSDPEAAVNGLLEEFGPDLFGIDGGDLELRPEGELTENGSRVLRGQQQVGRVPVLDGQVVATVAAAETAPRLIALRGRVFPGLDVSTEPVVTAGEAAEAAEEASGGASEGEPRLVVLAVGEGGTLAWEVSIAGGTTVDEDLAQALYYVDAVRGGIASIRSLTVDAGLGSSRVTLRGPRPGAALGQVASGESVQVSGTGPAGDELTGSATRQDDGSIALVDTTAPFYDPQTGQGAIEVHDATGIEEGNEGALPGPLVESPSTEITDPDAIGALAYTRAVLDYYLQEHGRQSWDAQGGSFIASIHFGGPEFCNSYFDGFQMVYGDQCLLGGAPQTRSDVDIDIVGHEITHGVNFTSSALNYVDQSGALDESFADYFGNVIGNLVQGGDDAAVFEDSCGGLSAPTIVCYQTPEGLATRYMLDATTMDDYLYLLDPSLGAKVLLGVRNDDGGVHSNSAIWNNALWTIRTRLAQLDGTSMIESPLARTFDDVVYAAYTQGLTSTSGFVDARAAIEQAAVESGADPVIVRIAQEVFDQNGICAGCAGAPPSAALGVSTAPAPQKAPAVSGDDIAWLDLAGSRDRLGTAVQSRLGGTPTNVSPAPNVTSLGFAGSRLLISDADGAVTLSGPNGAQTLKAAIGDCLYTGVAGSDRGGAWLDCLDVTLNFVDPAGTVTTGTFTGEGFPTAIGTGGGTVAYGTEAGEVFFWRPGQDPVLLGRLEVPIAAVDAHDDRVLAIAYDVDQSVPYDQRRREAVLFDVAGGSRTVLSRNAGLFGASLNDRYAVWAERTGALGGAISARKAASTGVPDLDTDLYLYSYQTGRMYVLISTRGQQGYPDLSGNRVVWQDASLGGQDVLTGLIPSGL